MEEGTNELQWVRMPAPLPRLTKVFSTRGSRPGRSFHAETTRKVRVSSRFKTIELSTVQLRPLRGVRAQRGYDNTMPG